MSRFNMSYRGSIPKKFFNERFQFGKASTTL
jgi:hypothetical protein